MTESEFDSTQVTLSVNGKKISGWTSATVRKSIEQFADEFDFELSMNRINEAGYSAMTGVSQSEVANLGARLLLRNDPEVRQDDAVQVHIGNQLVLSGYVDNVDLDYDGHSASLRFGGLSKAGDLVDSSAIHQTGVWKSATATTIVNDLCAPFGIDVLAIGSVGEEFKRFKIEQGESCYEVIRRATSMRQLLVISQPDGSIVLYRRPRSYQGARIELGNNVIRCTANRNRRDIHNRYILKGQTASSDDWSGERATQLEAVAEDPSVTRYRPKILIMPKQRTSEDLAKRAIWERNVRAGRGQRFRYTVPGWLNHKGELWDVNSLVWVKDDFARVDGEMLVSTVEFSLGERITTMIEVVPPGTFDPEDAPVGKKTRLG